MAGSITVDSMVTQNTTMGNLKCIMGVMDAADGAGQAIDTTLEYVASFHLTPKSTATNGGILFAKSGGNITPATCDSGDTWYVTVWGK
jgi:hypothetical protein